MSFVRFVFLIPWATFVSPTGRFAYGLFAYESSRFGSCLLWVMSTEISVDIAVDIAVDTRSIVGRHSVDSRSTLGRHSVDTRSTLGR